MFPLFSWLRPLFLLALIGSIVSGIYLFSVRQTPFVFNQRPIRRQELALAYLTGVGLLCFLFGGLTSFAGLLVGGLGNS